MEAMRLVRVVTDSSVATASLLAIVMNASFVKLGVPS